MNLDQQLDEIFMTYDVHFQSGEFEKVDTALKSLPVDKLNDTLLVGHLVAAFPAKDKLLVWADFCQVVKEELLTRHPEEKVNSMLVGLV